VAYFLGEVKGKEREWRKWKERKGEGPHLALVWGPRMVNPAKLVTVDI